jgi:hypothetical protein
VHRPHWRYGRYDTAAEAVRFAVEDIPPSALLSAYLVVDDERLGLDQIRHLHGRAAFPLKRAVANQQP